MAVAMHAYGGWMRAAHVALLVMLALLADVPSVIGARNGELAHSR